MRIDSQLKSLNKRTQHDMIKLTHIPHHPQLEFSTSIFNAMPNCIPWVTLIIFLTVTEMAVALTQSPIPTTLEGPFVPATRRFDPSLRRGSDDLPMDHPRLKKNVTSNFPEQIALAISSPTAMWVSWVTGDAQIGKTVRPLDPSTVGSEVRYGEESGKYTSVKKGVSVVYSQLYPFAGLLNYTSAIIHHVRIDGMEINFDSFSCNDLLIVCYYNAHNVLHQKMAIRFSGIASVILNLIQSFAWRTSSDFSTRSLIVCTISIIVCSVPNSTANSLFLQFEHIPEREKEPLIE
ncbi:hypothetical protein ACFX16_013257 [Malus domestica]